MTITADQARDRNRAAIVYLCDIQTLAGGPLLRLSDRNIPVGSVVYQAYLAGLSGLGDSLYRATGAFVNNPAALVFLNLPWDAYTSLAIMSETYPLEGAAVTIKQVHLDGDLTSATPETVFLGNLDSPKNITSITFACACVAREALNSEHTR